MSLLGGIEAFRDMEQGALDRLERASTVLQPRDGSEIFSQGDQADAVYAIVGGDGHVRIGAADRGSKTLMVAVYQQGDIFGEIGVIDGGAPYGGSNGRGPGAPSTYSSFVLPCSPFQ